MPILLIALILGIVEGVTEFLPVSSTAHLRIAEQMLGLSLEDPYWKMYTVVVQIGAILVLPIYFRERLVKFLSTFPNGERGDRTVLTHPLSLVAIAFIVTAIPSLLLVKVIGKHLESLYIIGMAFIGIQFSGWNTDWRFLFLGVILLGAVLVNNYIRKRAEGARR